MGLFNRSDEKHPEYVRDKSDSTSTNDESSANVDVFDPENGVKRGLENKHISMMAIAGIIGSGLIVGTGQALKNGGPAALIIGFGSIGLICTAVMQSIGEMSVFPDGGGFLGQCNRFVNRPFGAMISINYFLCFVMVLASEYSALMSIFTPGGGSSWNPHNTIPNYAVLLLFWGGFTFFQLVGVTAFGWSEYYLAWLKVLGIGAYFIFAIVYIAGGVKNRPAFGFHYWNDPGAFADGFKGVAKVFIFCSTFYAGAEGVAVTASESKNPGRAIPSAVKNTLVRILFIYMGSAIFIGVTCPSDALNDPHRSKSLMSPFTIGIQNAGWERGYHLINAFLIAVLLSGINASIFLCTRTLLYMANQGQLPKFLAWTDRRGVPIPAMVLTNSIGLISLMNISEGASQGYSYIVNISGVCIFFVWGGISLAHLRFRAAWKAQGYTKNDLLYKSWFFPIIPILSVLANLFLLLVQGWSVFVPFDYKNFIDSYIMIPVSIIVYILYAIYYKEPLPHKASDIDLISGRRQDMEEPKEGKLSTSYIANKLRRNKQNSEENEQVHV